MATIRIQTVRCICVDTVRRNNLQHEQPEGPVGPDGRDKDSPQNVQDLFRINKARRRKDVTDN